MVKKVVEYQIVTDIDETGYDFDTKVQEKIEEGWQPLGAPFVACRFEGDGKQTIWLSQAMVIYEEDDE